MLGFWSTPSGPDLGCRGKLPPPGNAGEMRGWPRLGKLPWFSRQPLSRPREQQPPKLPTPQNRTSLTSTTAVTTLKLSPRCLCPPNPPTEVSPKLLSRLPFYAATHSRVHGEERYHSQKGRAKRLLELLATFWSTWKPRRRSDRGCRWRAISVGAERSNAMLNIPNVDIAANVTMSVSQPIHDGPAYQ